MPSSNGARRDPMSAPQGCREGLPGAWSYMTANVLCNGLHPSPHIRSLNRLLGEDGAVGAKNFPAMTPDR